MPLAALTSIRLRREACSQSTILSTAERILKEPGYAVSFEQACQLAALSEVHPKTSSSALTRSAPSSRKTGSSTCAIINAKSGLCTEDCAFCAQSSHHSAQIEVYL